MVATHAEPTVLVGDPVLLELLVDNLIRNAVQHNRRSGQLWVCTGEDGITVENTGAQVTERRLAELVEPFRRGRQDRVNDDGGAGLGLAIVAAVARAHGGDLVLTPRAGGGVRVRMTLAGAD